MLKVYRINILFPLTPPSPLKEYVLYTQFNVDNYGQPFRQIDRFSLLHKIFKDVEPQANSSYKYEN